MDIWHHVMDEEDYRQLLRELDWLAARNEWGKANELVDTINDFIFSPNPHPVEGGFLAAKGALSEAWNGEPAEDTIRRLRDGE